MHKIDYKQDFIVLLATCFLLSLFICSLPVQADTTTVQVDIPSDAWINISGKGWYGDDESVDLGTASTVTYAAYDATKHVTNGWVTANVADLVGTLAPDYCAMVVTLPPNVWAYINDLGWFHPERP